MSDMPRHGTPQPDNDALRHTLSLSDVEALLITAGVPRSHRHVQRLCKSGAFDAQLLPGATGDQWRIAPHSVQKVIGDLRAIAEQRPRHGAPQHDTSQHVAADNTRRIEPDTARHGAPQHDTIDQGQSREPSTPQPDTARYVTLLEHDNEFLRDQVKKKDEQITDLSKRFGETQTLLGAMQRMLAPLLGQADPFNAPEKREVNATPADLSPRQP